MLNKIKYLLTGEMKRCWTLVTTYEVPPFTAGITTVSVVTFPRPLVIRMQV